MRPSSFFPMVLPPVFYVLRPPKPGDRHLVDLSTQEVQGLRAEHLWHLSSTGRRHVEPPLRTVGPAAAAALQPHRRAEDAEDELHDRRDALRLRSD